MLKVLLTGNIHSYALNYYPHICFPFIAQKYFKQFENEYDIITFGYTPYALVNLNQGDTFEDLLAKLPKNWYPDVCIVQESDYTYLPQGIEEAKFPLIGIFNDWDYSVGTASILWQMYDAIVVYSSFSHQVITSFGAPKVYTYPNWIGFLPEWLELKVNEVKDRDIDIFFSGIINDSFHPDRSKLLFKLAQLNEKYNICIKHPAVPISEYPNILNRTKIIFTYHRRGEMQGRLIEGLAMGALPICTKGEESSFFIDYNDDKELGEYVTYTEDNLIDIVTELLEDNNLIQNIVSKGHKKVRQSYTCDKQLKNLLDFIKQTILPDIDIQDRFIYLNSSDTNLLNRAKYVYNTLRGNAVSIYDNYLREIEQNLNKIIKKDKEVYTFLCIINYFKSNYLPNNLSKTEELFNDLINKYPDDAFVNYNYGYFLTKVNELDKALIYLNKFIELLSQEELFNPYFIYNTMQDNDIYLTFRRQLNDLLMLNSLNLTKESLDNIKNLLISSTHLMITLIYLQKKDLNLALEHIKEAFKLDKRGIICYYLAHILEELNNQDSLNYYEQALNELPLSTFVLDKYLNNLLIEQKYDQIKSIINKYSLVSSRINILENYKPKLNYFNNLLNMFTSPTIYKKTEPKVSIIIPLYNYENYIASCIESAIEQTYKNIEIIVVDDGSTDNSANIVKKYEKYVKYIYQRKDGYGTVKALNNGIRNASGEYFAWLSADDEFYKDKIELQLDTFLTLKHHDPNLRLIYTEYDIEFDNIDTLNSFFPNNLALQQELKEKGKVKVHLPLKNLRTDNLYLSLLIFHGIHAPTVFMPMSVFEEIDYFNESYPRCGDWDLWCKIAQHGYNIHLIPKPLILTRFHPVNTKDWHEFPLENAIILRQLFKITPFSKFLNEKFYNNLPSIVYNILGDISYYQKGYDTSIYYYEKAGESTDEVVNLLEELIK